MSHFYFLRDLAHRHQHHNPNTDTIVDIYECRALYDDFPWRRETLYSLFRKIIHLKRIRDRNSVINALGLLAYAQAFQEVCERSKRTKNIPSYNFDALKQSMEGAQKGINIREGFKSSSSEKKWATFFSVFAILATLALLGKPSNTDASNFHWIIRSLYDLFVFNPIDAIVLSLMVTWIIIVFRPGVLDMENWRIVRYFTAIGHATKRDFFLVVMFLPLVLFLMYIPIRFFYF